MTPKVPAIPSERPQLSVYLTAKNAAGAIEFYKKAFGAVELQRMADPAGKVGHAELKIGQGCVMISDEFPEWGAASPETLGGSPVMIHLYVDDADATVAQAEAAGARVAQPIADQFYGDRGAKLINPFGHKWWIATHIEDVPPEELKKRAKALYGME